MAGSVAALRGRRGREGGQVWGCLDVCRRLASSATTRSWSVTDHGRFFERPVRPDKRKQKETRCVASVRVAARLQHWRMPSLSCASWVGRSVGRSVGWLVDWLRLDQHSLGMGTVWIVLPVAS
eukprot:41326-Chlamydomonas_euryale.AAC.1